MYEDIRVPSLLVDREKVGRNVLRMKERADRNGVFFRPHLKTHQSLEIGRLFRGLGITAGTVSSVGMARCFTEDGWNDLTIAFPANIREMKEMDDLAGSIHLGLLADSVETVKALSSGLSHPADLWIKVDTGSRRCGIPAEDGRSLLAMAKSVSASPVLRLAGLLTHDSRSYGVQGPYAVGRFFQEGLDSMRRAQERLAAQGFPDLPISFGDTPSLSLMADWTGMDEARPGNFAYYDLQQTIIGSCSPQDVAVAVACPVVGIYPERSEAVVYGGAVHLSKQGQLLPGIGMSYGVVYTMEEGRWTGFSEGEYVSSVTQEHGVVRLSPSSLNSLHIGDLLFICPAHSCLSADLLRNNTVYL